MTERQSQKHIVLVRCNKISYRKQIARQHWWSTVYNIYLTSSLITMQILVAVSHTVRAHIHKLGSMGPTPWNGGVIDALEARYFSPCVITLVFGVGQTVWA